MKEITINNVTVRIKRWRQYRVLTLREIGEMHQNSYDSTHAPEKYKGIYGPLKEGVDYFKLTSKEMKKCDPELEKGSAQTVITEQGYRKLKQVILKSKTCNPAAVHAEILERYYQGLLREARDCSLNPEGFVGSLIDEGLFEVSISDEHIQTPKEIEEAEEMDLIEMQMQQKAQEHQLLMEKYQKLIELAKMQVTREIKDKIFLMAATLLAENQEVVNDKK